MKTIIATILILCSPMLAYAENCATSVDAETVEETRELKTDVPAHLKGATITIKLADGRESVVPAEKFKVVPRLQQFVIAKTKQQSTTLCSADKNRVSLLAGTGPKGGLDTRRSGNTVTVESQYGPVGGAQIQHLFTEKVSGALQLQTNESVFVGIGYEF